MCSQCKSSTMPWQRGCINAISNQTPGDSSYFVYLQNSFFTLNLIPIIPTRVWLSSGFQWCTWTTAFDQQWSSCWLPLKNSRPGLQMLIYSDHFDAYAELWGAKHIFTFLYRRTFAAFEDCWSIFIFWNWNLFVTSHKWVFLYLPYNMTTSSGLTTCTQWALHLRKYS